MERVKLTEDLTLSRFIHGAQRLLDWQLDKGDLVSLIEYCLELGITSIDHADIYGTYSCEEKFGSALAGNYALRDQLELITKCGVKLISAKYPDHKIKYYDTRKAHIIHSAENSLRLLNTDRIDVLLIHRPDPFMDPEEVAEAFNKLKKDGKVLSFGVSNFNTKQFNMLQSYWKEPLVTNQIEASVAVLDNWDNGTIDFLLQQGVKPMAWSPLNGGRVFSGRDEQAVRLRTVLDKIAMETDAEGLDQVMFAWLLAHPVKFLPIIGSGKKQRLAAAVKAADIKLSRMQWFEIWEASIGQQVA